MKNKKLFAILTLVCFLFTLMPVAAWADGEDTVILKVDSKNVYKNGEVMTTDVAPTIVDGRTIVPVRIIIEALGGSVDLCICITVYLPSSLTTTWLCSIGSRKTRARPILNRPMTLSPCWLIRQGRYRLISSSTSQFPLI